MAVTRVGLVHWYEPEAKNKLNTLSDADARRALAIIKLAIAKPDFHTNWNKHKKLPGGTDLKMCYMTCIDPDWASDLVFELPSGLWMRTRLTSMTFDSVFETADGPVKPRFILCVKDFVSEADFPIA